MARLNLAVTFRADLPNVFADEVDGYDVGKHLPTYTSLRTCGIDSLKLETERFYGASMPK